MIAIIIWAHRQRLSVGQTHLPPAAAVGCSRGPLCSRRRPEAVGQSPSAPLRRTRPTLTNIAIPNRLPSQKQNAPSICSPKAKHFNPSAVALLRLRSAEHPTQRQRVDGCVHFQRYAVATLPYLHKRSAARTESPAPAPAPLQADGWQAGALPQMRDSVRPLCV